MAINETTLEARLNQVLTTVFPTFREVKVEHQKSFSIRFGHHNVRVDLEEPSTRPAKAILDILLTVEGKNVILLELKKEGLPLKPEDTEQGISYARLLHPIPPLTLISNGIDNRFYNSITKKLIDRTDVDMGFIQNLIDQSFELAVSGVRDAVGLLMNKEPELFAKVINSISEETFERYTGAVDDIYKPISPALQINRTVLASIEKYFSENAALIGLVGPAYSGKTNLLYQFFLKVKSQKSFVLYVDCKDSIYSIYRQLAKQFSVSMGVSISHDNIRNWLMNSLRYLPDCKFYLLVDNFNEDIPEDAKMDIREMIGFFNGINHHTLYTTDELNFKEVAYQKNRKVRTVIGEKSKIITLAELDDDEYQQATELLWQNFQVVIDQGGYHSLEYREPRVIRQIASNFKNNIQTEKIAVITAVPNLSLLEAISGNDIYTDEVRELYEKLVECFFAERALREIKPDLYITAYGSGAITEKTFKRRFPDDFQALLKSTLVVVRPLENREKVIYPKVRDLFAFHSIEVLTRLILEKHHSGKVIAELSQLMITVANPIPYCDIVVTGALLKIAYSGEVDLFSQLVQELLKTPPEFTKATQGTEMLSYLEDVGRLRLKFEDDMDEGGIISNFLPYAVLSQLAGHPLRQLGTSEDSSYDFQLHLLDRVGSSPEFLGRVAVSSFKNMRSYNAQDLDGIGHLVSAEEGIIEPIVQSIKQCFLIIPDELERLYDFAFQQDKFVLLWRMYLAIRTLTGYEKEAVAYKAKDFVNRFKSYSRAFFANYFTQHIKDSEQREIARKKLSSLNVDDNPVD